MGTSDQDGFEGQLLKLQGISKKYPGVQALKGVNFEVFAGEVHALVGENGAGKSTLIKIITGASNHDEGEIIYKGSKQENLNPKSSRDLGIGVTYQEINLIGTLSVAENIFFGQYPLRAGFMDWQQLNRDATKLLDDFDLSIDPTMPVSSLSIGQQQLVEIVRAGLLTRDLIIMDEPTAALSQQDTELLFKMISRLKSRGTSVIYVSHRLEEILRIADRITVLRDGQYVGTLDRSEATRDSIIHMMVGRELSALFPKEHVDIGPCILEVKNFSKRGFFQDINFSIRKGEILGFFGLLGSGRTEVARAIFGIDHVDRGEIYLDGQRVNISSPRVAIYNGLGLVPEDRKSLGLLLSFSLRENISLPNLSSVTRSGLISTVKERGLTQYMLEKLDVRTPTIEQKAIKLSGGNQQKVVIAKWLSRTPKVLIVDEPTRGIDVATKTQVHALLSKLAKDGIGILMISSELPEILGMSDRILVFHNGRIAGEFNADDVDSEDIMRCATGEYLPTSSPTTTARKVTL